MSILDDNARGRLVQIQLKLAEAALDFYGTLGLLDPRDIMADLDGFGFYPTLVPPYYRQNQKRGEVLPVYTTELQLRVIRDRSRKLCEENGFAICAIENCRNYIVGKGFVYRAVPKHPDVNPALVRQVQQVIDGFVEANELADVESETVERLHKDGEALIRVFRGAQGLMQVRFVEPELVTAPTGESYGDVYSFGIQSAHGDIETRVGYWIVEDPIDNPYPAFVPACDVVHVKLNTGRTSKRGLPTVYPVESNLRRADDLLASMTSMAKTRAKIALIRKFNAASQQTAQNMITALTDATVTDPATGAIVNLERLRFGTILNASKSIDYEMPSADIQASDYVAVLQAELRAIAARMNMPEWMLTADASNANLASSLVAEAPSTKSFERLQHTLKRRFGECRYSNRESLVWKQLKHAIRLGLLPPETVRVVDVQCEAPSLVVRDKLQEANVNKIYCQELKVKSPQTIQQELGLDAKQEESNFASVPQAQQPAPAGGGGEGQQKAAPPTAGTRASEAERLREEGFSGIDSHGHKWEDGHQVKRDDAGGGKDKEPASGNTPTTAHDRAEGNAAVDHAVATMRQSAEGRATLKRAKGIVGKLKSSLHDAVAKILDAVDEKSGGGISLLGHGIKSASPSAIVAGVGHIASSIYECVHTEIFEEALSKSAGFPGAAIAGKVAASAANAGQGALLAGITWAMGKLTRRQIEALLREAELTPADRKLLEQLAALAGKSITDLLAEAGIDYKPDMERLQKRILAGLGKQTQEAIVHEAKDDKGHEHGADGRFSSGGSGGKSKEKNSKGGKSAAASSGQAKTTVGPSKPEERHTDRSPEAKPWKAPPPKVPRPKDQALRPKGDESQTKLGDQAESLATKFGFRSILPEGRRSNKDVKTEGSSIDLEFDHSGKAYELKMCRTTSTEYRLKAKAKEKEDKERYAKMHKVTAYTMIGVHDHEKNEVHFYAAKKPGLTGKAVNPDDFDYIGTAKF